MLWQNDGLVQDCSNSSALAMELLQSRFCLYHYNDVTWTPWRLKSPDAWLFVRRLMQVNAKENIKASRYWLFVRGIHLLWRESTGDRRLRLQRDSNMEKVTSWRHHDIDLVQTFVQW